MNIEQAFDIAIADAAKNWLYNPITGKQFSEEASEARDFYENGCPILSEEDQ